MSKVALCVKHYTAVQEASLLNAPYHCHDLNSSYLDSEDYLIKPQTLTLWSSCLLGTEYKQQPVYSPLPTNVDEEFICTLRLITSQTCMTHHKLKLIIYHLRSHLDLYTWLGLTTDLAKGSFPIPMGKISKLRIQCNL